MNEEKPKSVPSDYQNHFTKKPTTNESLKKILSGITDKTVVDGGKLDPKEMAARSYKRYKEHHQKMAEGEGHDCEHLWIDSMIATLETIGVPALLTQVIVNEWMLTIRTDKPDFLEGGGGHAH